MWQSVEHGVYQNECECVSTIVIIVIFRIVFYYSVTYQLSQIYCYKRYRCQYRLFYDIYNKIYVLDMFDHDTIAHKPLTAFE